MRAIFIQLFVLTTLLSSLTAHGQTANKSETPESQPAAPIPEGRSDAQLSEEQYVRLTKAVFEVVIPRIEDKDIVYQEKLPEHLLPFKIRKSPFRGIGTAFALGANRFVSAAHVFDLHHSSQVRPVYIRDMDGKTY